jgi:peptide/nickel transport system permease protein
MVAMLAAVSAVTFVVFYVLPGGDPAEHRAGPKAKPANVEAIRRQLNLDKPKIDWPWEQSQVRRYYGDLILHGDLGYSYRNDASVRELITGRLPASAQLAVGGILIALLVALPVGILSAVRRRSLFDRMAMGFALVLISAPVYWLGLMTIQLFDDPAGRYPLVPTLDAYPDDGMTGDPSAWFQALLLPWVVLGASFAAVYARLLRSSLSEVMSQDYIRTARAKGLSERRVVLDHGLRAAVTPLVTVVGIDLGILLGGAVLVETAFNIPGLGRLFVDAVKADDLPTIQGTVLFAAFFIVALTLVVDLVYKLIDPRVRLGEAR